MNNLPRLNRLSLTQIGRIASARVFFVLGWPGCLGLICMALSAGIWIWLWQPVSPNLLEPVKLDAPFKNKLEIVTPNTLIPPALPRSANALQVLRQIKGLAQTQDLSWPKAEYKLTPISNESLATLEVRTTFKGPYPKLRHLMATLSDKDPAIAMRELTLTRPNGDAIEVEAKIHWVVFLADGWAPAEQGHTP